MSLERQEKSGNMRRLNIVDSATMPCHRILQQICTDVQAFQSISDVLRDGHLIARFQTISSRGKCLFDACCVEPFAYEREAANCFVSGGDDE